MNDIHTFLHDVFLSEADVIMNVCVLHCLLDRHESITTRVSERAGRQDPEGSASRLRHRRSISAWDRDKRLDDGWDVQSRERNLTKSSLSALPPKVRPDVRGAREHIKRGSGVKYRQTDTEEITSNMNQRSELQLQPYTKTRFILRAVRL